jgi:hypothetical protein
MNFKNLAFIFLIGIAASAPILGVVALIKLVTDIRALQIALAFIVSLPTFFVSLLSSIWIGEKFDNLLD